MIYDKGRCFVQPHSRDRSKQPSVASVARRWVLAFGVMFGAMTMTGCSVQRLHEVDHFAALGSSYVEAVDQTLVQTGRLVVSANSQRLLDDRALSPVSQQDLEAHDETMRDTAKELSGLREQVILLGDYFRTLGALSSSKAPSQIAAGLDQSASSMASLSTSAGAGSASSGRVLDAGAGMGSFLIKRRRMKLLESELTDRRELIRQILDLQSQLLRDLREMAVQQVFVGRRNYTDNVIKPFIASAPLPCPEAWVHGRQSALFAGSLPSKIDLILIANQRMSEVWARLVDEDLESLDLAQLQQMVEQASSGPVGLPAVPLPSTWSCFSVTDSVTNK